MNLAVITKVLDFVPGWLWALLLAVSCAFGWTMSLENAHTLTKYEKLSNDHLTLIADVARAAEQRERVARQDAEQVARTEFRHAELQQEQTNENAQRAAARAAADRARAADDQRLRDDIAATPGRGAEGAVDAAACRRDGNLARQFAADLAEAVGLQGEAEAFIRQRDDEVTRLRQQIDTDRSAVQGAQ